MPKTKNAAKIPNKKRLSGTITKEEPGTTSEIRADSNQVPTATEEPHNRGESPLNSSEDESDGATVCSGHEHFELDMEDEVVDFPVDTLYKMLFTDHSFSEKFMKENKCTGVKASEWSSPDEGGDRTRTVTYNITYRTIGLRTAKTTEKQTLCHCSSPGSHYVVDSTAETAGIPYGETFFLKTRFCLTKNTENTTRLRITCRVVYTKKVVGIIKGFIEKNVEEGSKESYSLMVRMLHEDAKQLFRSPETCQCRGIDHKSRKQFPKSKKHQNGMDNSRRCISKYSHSTANQTKSNSYLGLRLVFGVLILIVSLTYLNVMLFNKLRLVQEEANLLLTQTTPIHRATKIALCEDGTMGVFKNEKKWKYATAMMKDVLSGTDLLLKQMKEMLAKMKDEKGS